MRSVRNQPRKESVDERDTSKEWRGLGYVELKIMTCNHDGWPDRWYKSLALGIPAFWCEWKAVGKEAEPHQVLRHDELRAQGETVIVAHTRREFWDHVRRMQAAARL